MGAQSKDLAAQVESALPIEPEIAIILVGANDVTHTVRPSQSVAYLSEAVTRLRGAGVAVVVGTCPDLGTIKAINAKGAANWKEIHNADKEIKVGGT